jgi:hypothetical protein
MNSIKVKSMSDSSERPAVKQPESEHLSQPKPSEEPIDVRELVYRGGYSGDPREIVENPAVAPEMLEQAPEDIRDDLMPKGEED